MDEILNLSVILGKKIVDSSIYKAYAECKQKLFDDIDKKTKVFAFKKMQIEIEYRRSLGESISEEEDNRLEELYSDIMLDTISIGFIEKERALLNMISSVFETIQKETPIFLELDLP